MIVLAIETAHEYGSIALGFGSEIVEEVPLHAADGFSGILFQAIEALLERNTLKLAEVDLYGVGNGPGSFTGVRVGITAAKSLAAANGKSCYGVSTLTAMANYGTAPTRAVLLDARRGEIYGAVFGEHSQQETVSPIDSWLKSLPHQVAELLSFDFAPFAESLDLSPFAHTARMTVPRELASSIASIALENFRAGVPGDPALLDANYVRRSDAELFWKE